MKKVKISFYNLLLLISVTFIGVNCIIGFSKPVWLDEASTLLEINYFSPMQIFIEFYKGIDTHPPFYFVTLSFVKYLTGINSEILFRVISLIYMGFGVYFNYLFFRRMDKRDAFNIYLVIFSITNFFIHYISFEIRPYSLFFLLFSIYLYLYIKRIQQGGQIPLLILTMVLLLYTHYFSIYYLLLLSLFEIVKSLKSKKFDSLLGAHLVSLLLFIFWIPAIINQLNYFSNTKHHNIPEIVELFPLPFEWFRYLSIFIGIIIIIYFFYIINNKRRINKDKILIIFLLYSLALLPNIIYVLFHFDFAVYAARYFIPSALSVLILTSFALNTLLNFRIKSMQIIFILITLVFGLHRINQSFIISKKSSADLNYRIELSKKLPLVCETPHSFLPLYYYSGFDSSSNIFFILDSITTAQSKPYKHALFDYIWWNKWKKEFNLPNVMSWNDFISLNKEFYIVNEYRIKLFETRILDNQNFFYKPIGDSVLYCKVII